MRYPVGCYADMRTDRYTYAGMNHDIFKNKQTERKKRMKKMKKLVSLLLTVVMVMAMTVVSVSAETQNFKVSTGSDDSHTYAIYQIFTGDYDDATGVLSNIKWGSDAKLPAGAKVGDLVSEDVLNALKAVNGTDKTDKEKMTVISNYVEVDETAAYTLTADKREESVPAGYYFIKDTTTLEATADDSLSANIVKVVKAVTITPKKSKPTFDKQVYDDDDFAKATAKEGFTEDGDNDGWKETADHAINESFQFRLTATLAPDADYDAYETYKVVFTDTMSTGITFESIASVRVGNVTLNDNDYTLSDNAKNAATTPFNGDGTTAWTLTINDIKQHLPEGTKLSAGTTVEVIYNAHLNEAAKIGNVTDNNNKAYLQYSNNPNAGGEGNLGKTPEDTVWVFTYEMDNTKVDGSDNNKPLAGAGFRLYKADGTTEIKLKKGDDEVYRPVKSAAETGEEMFSAATTGKFNIEGLDAGKYVLKETTTPSGYNTCAPITVIIRANHKEINEGASASTTILLTRQDGETETEVNSENVIQNNQGATLPETGGIGTTIFYVLGAILVLGAGIVLVTRRRMSVEK